MGYESHVVIGKKSHYLTGTIEVLAELNLSCMPYGFTELFDKEWKYGYYPRMANTVNLIKVEKDVYGAVGTYTTLDKVLKFCLNHSLDANYRRLDMLCALLVSIKQGWCAEKPSDMIVIHYGY